jgi:hypothetical protein
MNKSFATPAVTGVLTNSLSEELFHFGDEGMAIGKVKTSECYLGGLQAAQ